MATVADSQDLTREEYELIRRLVYAKSGINLGDQKMQLVRARLGKRLRRSGFKSYREYYRFVEADATGEELCRLLDAISTNTTHLFREIRHFTLLKELIRGWVSDRTWRAENPALRIWSAGCSSGEEPHSIAMVAHDALRNAGGVSLKLLATDLSVQMLSRAKLGLYDLERVGTVPAEYRNRYLQKVREDGKARFQIVPELRQLLTFARFNLMAPQFPFREGFHIIFCRNVMIYFDQPTRESLVKKYTQHLRSGGHLMIGHSETLNNIQHSLTYAEPTVYRK